MEPSVSATWTASGMFPGALKLALPVGLVSVTLGSEFTMTVTGAEVELAPWLSVSVAVSFRQPAAALLSVTLYGALVAAPTSFAPLWNSTFAIEPSLSEALAVTVKVAGAVRMALFPGAVMATPGKAFTVIETGSERSVSPLLFVALAITAYRPAGTADQMNRYRSLRLGPATVPISFVP